MINKESLFIGCWVHVPCLVDEVEGIDGNRRIKQLYDDSCDVEGFKELKYSEIEPIPITPKFLKNNGFNPDPDNDKGFIGPNDLYVATDGVTYDMMVLDNTTIDFKYIHEFQYLLKLLDNFNKKEIIL